jgi:hypothetical protein
MARAEPARNTRPIINPSDPEGRRAAFETLLRSDRFAEHRRRLRAEVEHWPPIKDMPPGALPPDWTVKERSPSEEAAFRQEISRYVLDTTLYHCWLYYRAFLPEGDADVRRSRAAVIATAERASKLAGELATAMRRLWRSGDPAVQQIFAPLAAQYPRGDGLPVVSIVLPPEMPQRDEPPHIIGDPGFVVMLEEMRRQVELLAAALPADVGGRRPSVVFEELAVWLAGIYSGVTGLPAQVSTRAGAREGQYFRFVKAVVGWLNDAAPELGDVKFDFPATDDALRMVLHRMAQANTTATSK